MRRFFTSAGLLVTLAVSLHGAAINSEGVEFFESRIRPVLVTECYQCHGPGKSKGGLCLDSRDAILEGGDSGPVTTVTFEEKGGKTLLVLHDLYPSKEALDAAGTGAADAMGETFRQLDELLVTLDASMGRS